MKTCCECDETKVESSGNRAHEHMMPEVNLPFWKENWPLIFGLIVLFAQLLLTYAFQLELKSWLVFIINALAYILAGKGVLVLAWKKISRGDFFNEFVLMSVATLGAFYLGEFSEGLAVMVFYSIGEWFQDAAVRKAKSNIKELLDSRPDEVEVVIQGKLFKKPAAALKPGEIIRVKPGEKIALDGLLLSTKGVFNTSALTGESKPDTKYQGESILAGMLNLNYSIDMQVSTSFKDSKLSQILALVQDASARKSQTQLFISRFAKIYTPIVFFLAFAVVVVPFFFLNDYNFQEWLYRALVFLVISCPCALVVSIPLGYFGGIGLASKQGILVKGGNYLDALTQLNTLVTDKTGTLTWGLFEVQEIHAVGMSEAKFLHLLTSLESHSSHPIAQAIGKYAGEIGENLALDDIEEIPGQGLKALWHGKVVLGGNYKLLEAHGINYPASILETQATLVLLALDGVFQGYLSISDRVKENAGQAITDLQKMGLEIVMLSGDRQAVVKEVAKDLHIASYYGDLLPKDKVEHVEQLKKAGKQVAFVGDGINDAPVLALADVGIAMGGLGSDAAIETADIVIQNDNIYKLVRAIEIAKITRTVVWQNIILAMSVKIIVLILGAGGMASLWEAVIADVGVALLAILNAVRVQQKKFKE